MNHDPSVRLRYADQFPQHNHLWVWINEPQHSAAISAIFSIVAILIASAAAYFAYKTYKAQTEELAITKDTARFAIEPFFDTTLNWRSDSVCDFVIRNSGGGPALRLRSRTEDDTARFGSMITGKPGVLWFVLGSLPADPSREARASYNFPNLTTSGKVLMIFDCFDRAGRKHQEQILIRKDKSYEISRVIETDYEFRLREKCNREAASKESKKRRT